MGRAMDCEQAQQLLQARPLRRNALLRAHLAGCERCRTFASDQQLITLLQSSPGPAADPTREERILQRALNSSRPTEISAGPALWPLATAAAVLLTVLVMLPFSQETREVPVSASVPVQPGQSAGMGAPLAESGPREVSQTVSVVLESARALEGATIRIELPPHLLLDGYGGRRALEWQADIVAGSNRLELPLRRQPGAHGGEILIEIEHQGDSKRLRLPVPQPPPPEVIEKAHGERLQKI